MKIFNSNSYVEVIKYALVENSSVRGYQSRMAEAIQVHNSYLSRVLSEQVHLTPDQAVLLGNFWRLDEDEMEYFLALLHYQRAGTKELRQVLKHQLERIRRKQEDLAERFKDAKLLVNNDQGLYYSAWYFSAIHFLLLVPGFNRPNAIAQRLGLPLFLVESALQTLAQMGLAREEKREWSAIISNLHLSNMSHWSSIYHSNWRQRVGFKLQERNPDDFHFTGLQVMSEKDFGVVKGILRDLVEEVRNIALPSKEENLYCLGADWFKV